MSITGIETVSSTVVGDNTNTTLRAHYSDNTTDEFVVTAKNGKNGNATLYMHTITLNAINNENLPMLRIKYVSANSDKITTFAKISEIAEKSISMLSIGKDTETVPPSTYSVSDVRLISSGPHKGELSVDVFTSYPYSYQSIGSYYFESANTKIEDKVGAL